MRRRRDTLLGAGAVVVVALLAVLVVLAVLQARRSGRKALEELQQAQIDQVAASQDERLESTLRALDAWPLQQPWNLTPGDAGDGARLAQLANRSGALLLADDGTIVNGVELPSPELIGTRYAEPIAADVLGAGATVILPAAPSGVTAGTPILPVPIPFEAQGRRYVVLLESRITPDSAFNQEIAKLGRGETGDFSFVDRAGVVVASSDESALGRPMPEAILGDGEPGFRRAGGRVAAVADMPRVGWRAVFEQSASEFDGSFTGPIRSALLLLLLAGIVGTALLFAGLLARLRAARVEQQRLERINVAQQEFISIVSHELRTPVAGLLGFLQAALDRWDVLDETERRQAVARSLSNARRLASLSADVIDTTLVEGGELPLATEQLDLRDEVSRAADAARETAPGRTVHVELPGEPVWVLADGPRLQQVLRNLLDNAVKHGPPDAPVEVRLRTSGDDVQVSVTDHGPGIAEAELERIFEKFVRGRGSSARGGSGLGLYICRQIVDAHGGRVWASSGDAGGATLTFTLPVVAGAPVPVDR